MRLRHKKGLEGAILALAILACLTQASENGWAQDGAGQAESLPPGADSVATTPAPGDTSGAGASGSSPTAPAGTLPIGQALPELSNNPGGDQDPGAGAATLTGQAGDNKDMTTVTGESRRFKYAFGLSANATYDDNIYLDDRRKENDVYFDIAPSVTLGFGDVVDQTNNYIRLDYSPSIFLYAKHSKNDAVQHLIRLAGQYTFSKLTITGSQQVELLNGTDLNSLNSSGATVGQTNLDVSARTRANIYTTMLNASYPLTGKISLSFGGQFTLNDYETLLDSSNLSGNLYATYEYSPKLNFGAGLTGGWQFVSDGPDQGYIQTNLRGNYQLSGKVAVNGSVGIEFRQSTDKNGLDVTPVFNMGAVYQATDSTTISISATRQVTASAVLRSQDFESTAVTVGLRQRFFQRIYLGLDAGYENDDYVSEQKGIDATREDNYFFIQPSLAVPIRQNIALSVFYRYRENSSSGAGDFGFSDNQVGITATINF